VDESCALPARAATGQRLEEGKVNVDDMEVVLRKEGEFWTLEFQGTIVHLRDAKGLRYLARLLASPEQPLAAHDLCCCAGSAPGVVGGEASPAPSTAAFVENATAADTRFEAAERARSAVTKRIKDAIRKIHACHPVLGRHLMRTVKTGCACVYQPDPDRPTRWVLS
jgi:hypothetical protein